MRTALLMTTAVVLSLSMPGLAAAQQAQPTQPNQTVQQAAPGGQAESAEVRRAKDTIRQAREDLEQARADLQQPGDAGQQARNRVHDALRQLEQAAADLRQDDAYRQVGTQLEERSRTAMATIESGSAVNDEGMRAIEDVEATIIVVEEQGGAQQRSDAEGAQISVEQANPQIDVRQPPPQVAVQQPEPQVQVQQRQPEVTVQQRQPEVQVQQPPPEVTVHQPRPEVTVRQPEPEVTVRQREPEVTVQAQQPDVQVQQPRPEVTVQQPRPEVTVQQPQPEVTVDQPRPEVAVEQSGQPEVRVEQSEQAEVQVDRQSDQQARPLDRSQSDLAVIQPGQDSAAAGDTGIRGWPAGMSVDDLMGRDVHSAAGENIGDVQDVIVDPQSGRVHQVVVGIGGFLGIGQRDVALDYNRLSFDPARDALTVDATREQLEAMQEFENDGTMTSLRERGTR
ncbi:PRC-barrel domain-containing protein [Azospirillum halopraeferens]|uniref:PRC-barrel domain-containing protein n=1 Tax=Azospirillum halopraeferens TaxID=34010 RepID=UPI0006876E6C|nr:PRC-barrel domain-containing protein [Azospirillum halopraeferens]